MSNTQLNELEAIILDVLTERGRISITDLANDLDSTSQAIQIPLGQLKEEDKITITGDDVFLKMSAKDRKDFDRLDKKFNKGQRESIAALREIRERRLFREQFATFDDYMESRGRTRQWATQQTNWLRVIELLEKHGKEPYHLSVDGAQPLAKLKDHPEEFVRALLDAEEMAQASDRHDPTKKMLKDAVSHQERFLHRRKALATPDLTYEENRSLDRLCEGHRAKKNLVELAHSKSEASGQPLSECLRVICEEERSLPRNKDLLVAARGEELAKLVDALVTIANELEEEDELEEEEQELQRKLSSVQRKLGRASEEDRASEDSEVVEEHTSASTDDEAISEESTGTQPNYEVEFTGPFDDWVTKQFGNRCKGEALLDHAALVGVFAFLVDSLKEQRSLSDECSITIRPLEDERPNGEEVGEAS